MALPEVTYAYYTDAYGGNAIEAEDWTGYEAKARSYLVKLDTLSRVTPYGDEETAWKMALCAVAEQYQNFDIAANGAASGGAVSSASIGTVSVSYDLTRNGAIDLSIGGREASLLDSVRTYLHVYAGVG